MAVNTPVTKIVCASILQYLRGDHEWPLQTLGSRLRKGVEPRAKNESLTAGIPSHMKEVSAGTFLPDLLRIREIPDEPYPP